MRPSVPVSLALAGALAALTLGAGCGDTDDNQDVRRTLERFERATAEKDVQELCDDLFSSTIVQRIRTVGLPCEVALNRALSELRQPKLEIGRIKIDGDTATVQVRSTAYRQPPSTDAVRLVKEENEWRVDSLAGAGPEPPG
jgi:hypothetical protein